MSDLPEEEAGLTCPHCQKAISVYFWAKARRLEPREPKDWRESLSLPERAAVDELERAGVVAAFSDAMTHVAPARDSREEPPNSAKALMKFLRECRPYWPTTSETQRLADEFGRTDCKLWTYRALVAVVVGGRIRAFIPSSSTSSKVGMSEVARNETLDLWIRGRYGYIAGEGPLFDAMRQRNLGDFARLVQ